MCQAWLELAATPVGRPLRPALLLTVPAAKNRRGQAVPAVASPLVVVGAQADGSFLDDELAMRMRLASAQALGELAWKLQGVCTPLGC